MFWCSGHVSLLPTVSIEHRRAARKPNQDNRGPLLRSAQGEGQKPKFLTLPFAILLHRDFLFHFSFRVTTNIVLPCELHHTRRLGRRRRF